MRLHATQQAPCIPKPRVRCTTEIVPLECVALLFNMLSSPLAMFSEFWRTVGSGLCEQHGGASRHSYNSVDG